MWFLGANPSIVLFRNSTYSFGGLEYFSLVVNCNMTLGFLRCMLFFFFNFKNRATASRYVILTQTLGFGGVYHALLLLNAWRVSLNSVIDANHRTFTVLLKMQSRFINLEFAGEFMRSNFLSLFFYSYNQTDNVWMK